MFKAIWKLGSVDIELAKEIRKSVFIEEMCLSESQVFDNRDSYSAHLEIFEEETHEPIAAARMYPDHAHGKDCDCCSLSVTHIGEIAVMKKYRTGKYYDLALRMLLYKAEGLSGKQIVADVFESELPIYQSFGFEVVEKSNNKIRVSVDKDKVRWHSECHGS